MGKFRNSQAGFGIVEVVIVLVIVAIVGAAGWLIYKNHHKVTPATTMSSSSETNKPATVPASAYAGWKTASFTQEGLTLKYPSGWSVLSQYVAGSSALIIGQHPLSQGG